MQGRLISLLTTLKKSLRLLTSFRQDIQKAFKLVHGTMLWKEWRSLIQEIYPKSASLCVSVFCKHLHLHLPSQDSFLQADWLTKTVLQHIKAETLQEEPMRMFRIGQRFHSAELTDDAIASVAKRGRKELRSCWIRVQMTAWETKETYLYNVLRILLSNLWDFIKESILRTWHVCFEQSHLLKTEVGASLRLIEQPAFCKVQGRSWDIWKVPYLLADFERNDYKSSRWRVESNKCAQNASSRKVSFRRQDATAFSLCRGPRKGSRTLSHAETSASSYAHDF